MVFFGEYQLTFSSPGRLVLPKKIRELLKGNIFVLNKGFGECLAGFDKDEWEIKTKELMHVSVLEQDNIDKKRYLFSSVVYLEIDDQGRFILPRNLLNYAKLKEKAVIIGVGDHFEIWNQNSWEEYVKNLKT